MPVRGRNVRLCGCRCDTNLPCRRIECYRPLAVISGLLHEAQAVRRVCHDRVEGALQAVDEHDLHRLNAVSPPGSRPLYHDGTLNGCKRPGLPCAAAVNWLHIVLDSNGKEAAITLDHLADSGWLTNGLEVPTPLSLPSSSGRKGATSPYGIGSAPPATCNRLL